MDDDDDEDYDPYDDMFSDEPQDNPVPVRVPKHSSFQLGEMKKRLLRKIEFLGEVLPPNTLDYLIEELGGPSQVAEMTGRKGRVVRSILGDRYIYEPRASDDLVLSNVNMDEKEKFMDGKKLVAIISEAASLGISLQSDRRVRNQRRRVHITLELPWSADKAIQQFGRTHRSNQVNAPEYVLLISQLAGERRFASTVSKRLEQLGALTHGDRRSTEVRDLSGFNFETKYGASALRSTLEAVNTGISTVAEQPSDETFLPRVKGAYTRLVSLIGCLIKHFSRHSRGAGEFGVEIRIEYDSSIAIPEPNSRSSGELAEPSLQFLHRDNGQDNRGGQEVQ